MQIPEIGTILGLGTQIPEIRAQRKFVSAMCHAAQRKFVSAECHAPLTSLFQ